MDIDIKQKLTYAYALLVVLYAAGTLLIPPAKSTLKQYHITLLHLHVLDVTFIILYAAIWFCGMYGFYNIHYYYQLIQKNREGKPLALLTTGLGFLAFWLPITSIYNLYSNYLVRRYPELATGITISQNYLTLLLPLLGFFYIGVGSRRLAEMTKQAIGLWARDVIIGIMIIIGVMYSYLVSTTPNRLNTTDHLNTPMILLTLVIPYIFMWFIGLLAVYELYIYRMKVDGIVYRNSWRLLAFGIGAIIGVSILIQYLTTISERLTRLSLNWLLLLIYLLFVLLAVSFILIAAGLRNLKRIEEV